MTPLRDFHRGLCTSLHGVPPQLVVERGGGEWTFKTGIGVTEEDDRSQDILFSNRKSKDTEAIGV